MNASSISLPWERRRFADLPAGLTFPKLMTVTPIAAPRKTKEITVAYLGELLLNAGFIDEKQKAEVDATDKQFKLQHSRTQTKMRTDEEVSPFKTLMAMNLSDASGS